LPRELSTPYASPEAKVYDWHRLLQRAGTLRELAALGDIPEDQWPNAETVNLLRASPPITNETVVERLKRWRIVFADELTALERAVSAASRPGGYDSLADTDLRSAVYLAGRLLATLYNVPISEVRP
jgi:hypothetical protein